MHTTTKKTWQNLTAFGALEVLPIILFYVAFHVAGFVWAVGVLAGATTLSLIVSIAVQRRVPYFALVGASATVLAAIATIAADDPRVLILKDTLYYCLFGFTLLLLQKRGALPLKKLFGHIFGITDTAWQILALRWSIFLIAAGIINALVGFFLTTEAWVTYKAALLIIFGAFGLFQFTVSKKHRLPDTNTWGLWT